MGILAMTRSRIALALALAAALALSACYDTTTHPLGTTAGIKRDPALIGTWKGVSADGKPGYFHFLAQTDGSITVLIVGDDKVSNDWNVATVTTTMLGANHLMNARLVEGDGKPITDQPPGTVPVLYRIDAKGTLTVALPQSEAVRAAIKAGKIKGRIEAGAYGDTTITADPRTLDVFFARPDVDKLFAEPFFTLHRVR
jgi:hypothetical protein